ncbi:hypothetical protein R3P38DRAFT_3073741 [Favolaschia claudopus]|uniref:Uncharacterized protein n=1 Tax=Favolaschia claudopus TaxID=2862362 RepID=A0AAV9ZXR1_9AGAR
MRVGRASASGASASGSGSEYRKLTSIALVFGSRGNNDSVGSRATGMSTETRGRGGGGESGGEGRWVCVGDCGWGCLGGGVVGRLVSIMETSMRGAVGVGVENEEIGVDMGMGNAVVVAPGVWGCERVGSRGMCAVEEEEVEAQKAGEGGMEVSMSSSCAGWMSISWPSSSSVEKRTSRSEEEETRGRSRVERDLLVLVLAREKVVLVSLESPSKPKSRRGTASGPWRSGGRKPGEAGAEGAWCVVINASCCSCSSLGSWSWSCVGW